MHFGDAQFSGATGIFQRGHSSSTGAARVTGHVDHIGTGLGHTNGDCADTFGANQLHNHLDAGGFGIVDQLGQILDRIGIVMRRRRNQLNPRRATTRGSNFNRNLGGRQLATFARLGTLTDFNFDLFQIGVGQIAGPNPEPSRGKLFNFRGPNCAIAADMFAALARI